MTPRKSDGEPQSSENAHSEAAPTTALGALLQAAKLDKAAPQSTRRAQRTEPAKPPKRERPRAPGASSEAREQELAARKRVAALVSGGVHFKVKRDGEQVQATRGSAAAKSYARLASKTYAPELTLDLRAQPDAEVGDGIAGYVRLVHRRGVRQLLIRIDEPTAPADVREQRRQHVVTALTLGAAAPLVRAFTSAHESLGGTRSLAVLLI